MKHKLKDERWCIGNCNSCFMDCEYSDRGEHKSLAQGIRDIIFSDPQIEFGLGGEAGLI